jgi:tRNA-dihydrouridine synthase A
VVINGGVDGLPAVEAHLRQVDGVMLGRAAYHDPWQLSALQARLFGMPGAASREEAVHGLTAYLERQVALGVPVKHVSRHVLGLYQGQPGARRWRRYLSQRAHLEPDNPRLLLDALSNLQPSAGPIQEPFMAMN